MQGIANYVRRHHVGLLALFVALGGTAYAVTAPENSVVSRSIKDGQVRAQDLGVVDVHEFPDTISVLPSETERLPTFTVRAPESGLVSLWATSEIKKLDTNRSECEVELAIAPSVQGAPLYAVDVGTGGGFGSRWTSPTTERNPLGALSAEAAGSIVLDLGPGAHELGVQYSSGLDTRCEFRSTKLVVSQLP